MKAGMDSSWSDGKWESKWFELVIATWQLIHNYLLNTGGAVAEEEVYDHNNYTFIIHQPTTTS